MLWPSQWFSLLDPVSDHIIRSLPHEGRRGSHLTTSHGQSHRGQRPGQRQHCQAAEDMSSERPDMQVESHTGFLSHTRGAGGH